MAALVSVEWAGMAVNVDGLPDSTAEIVRVLVQYLHIAPINAVLWLFGMLSHRGCGVAMSFMLPYPGSESTLRFTNIGCRTFLAVELVNNTRFVHSFDFILGGHKLLPDGVNWLVMGADALTLINTGNSLRDALKRCSSQPRWKKKMGTSMLTCWEGKMDLSLQEV